MDEGNELGDWKKILILGSGSFGIVSLWRHRTTNDCVAIKKCRWDQPANIPKKARDRWTQEVEFMKNVQHPNIVAYKNLAADFLAQLERFNLSRLPLLPMEYCSGGNLRRLLNQPANSCGLRESDARSVLDDISQAVSHLHRLQITHRDIKPENVVFQMGADARKTYKLIDLGYAKDMSLMVSFVGTLGYTAPEIFMNADYNHNVDYWSFGILAYEICCGKHPFLPKLPPVQRFELIAKKAPRDICVYQSQTEKIIYTDKILEPNHLSLCFRTHLEDWLGSMLEFQSAQRGITQNGDNVFVTLQNLLNKQFLHVFCVYTYTDYYYEINNNTKLIDLKRLIEKDSGLNVKDQMIIISKSTTATNVNDMLLLGDLNLSTLSVFKRGEFVRPEKVLLPLAVRNLLQAGKQQWDQLSVQTSQAVHYIEHETNKMRTLKGAVDDFYDYLHSLLFARDDVQPQMRSAAECTLNLVAFCKEVNAVCQYDASKQEAIKNYRRHLWRARELVENVNAATVRYMKMKTKARILKASLDKVMKWMQELNIDTIYDDAVKCMNINKQKAVITAEAITVVVCGCLKARRSIQHDENITQHMGLCFKLLREYDKLQLWMEALILQLQQASADLLDAQKNLSRTDCKYEIASSSGDAPQQFGNNRDDMPSVDDLIKDNRMFRYNMQEVLSGLLLTHKNHAVGVEEFVQFVDGLTD